MKRKVVRLTPDQLGYKDRGMMKWQGLMLSDHLDALRKQKKKDTSAEPTPKIKMSLEKISEVLHHAYYNKSPILMQANVVTNGHYYPDLKCLVLGYSDDKIYLKLIDGRQATCELSQIRNVEFMDPMQWFGKG